MINVNRRGNIIYCLGGGHASPNISCSWNASNWVCSNEFHFGHSFCFKRNIQVSLSVYPGVFMVLNICGLVKLSCRMLADGFELWKRTSWWDFTITLSWSRCICGRMIWGWILTGEIMVNVYSIDLISWCLASVMMSLTSSMIEAWLSLIESRVDLRNCDLNRGIPLPGEDILHDWSTSLSNKDSCMMLKSRRGSSTFILTWQWLKVRKEIRTSENVPGMRHWH